MRHRRTKLLFTMLVCMVSTVSIAHEIEVKNADGKTIYYNYINDGKELEVTNCTPKSFDSYSGNIKIPEEVTYMNRTRKVTSIGKEAFYKCRDLAYVSIPNSVTSIGDWAFHDCPKLSSLSIPQSVTSIGSSAFWGCKSLTTINIPSSITVINSYTFASCTGLTSVTIPNSVINIGDCAFGNCSSLPSITLPNSVTSIGYWAFQDCSSLTSISIPQNVNFIGGNAFDGINLLYVFTKVKVPFSITGKESNDRTFSKNTFNNATLYVPAGTINRYKAWDGWKDFLFIEELDSSGGETPYNPIGEEPSGLCGETVNYSYEKASQTLTISGKGTIFDYDNGSNKAPWSSYADEIQKIEVESGITSIGYFAFYQCRSVTSLSIPATVGYIGSSAFEDCTGLTSLSLNEGLLSIGGSAFEGCSGLQTLSIPSTVNSISINAFKNCKGITDVYCYAETVPDTHSDAFDGTPTETSTLYVPAKAVEAYKTSWPWSDFMNIVVIGSTPADYPTSGSCGESVNYSYDKASQTLTISGKGAIYDYDNGFNKAPWSSYAEEIQKIEVESGITSIGYFAFYYCSSITSLSIPATVGYIGSSAFEDCTSLTSLSLNEGLLSIGGSSFESCTGLKTLIIPSTVNTISINAFKNCQGITDVYCYAETVPDTHFDAFDATPTEKSTLHVPVNSVEAYRASWPWSDFKAIVPLGPSGDANDDGVVDDKDINAIVDFLMNGKTDGFNFNNADANNDKKVNAADIVEIINRNKKL